QAGLDAGRLPGRPAVPGESGTIHDRAPLLSNQVKELASGPTSVEERTDEWPGAPAALIGTRFNPRARGVRARTVLPASKTDGSQRETGRSSLLSGETACGRMVVGISGRAVAVLWRSPFQVDGSFLLSFLRTTRRPVEGWEDQPLPETGDAHGPFSFPREIEFAWGSRDWGEGKKNTRRQSEIASKKEMWKWLRVRARILIVSADGPRARAVRRGESTGDDTRPPGGPPRRLAPVPRTTGPGARPSSLGGGGLDG